MAKTAYGVFLEKLANYEEMLKQKESSGAVYSTKTGTFFAAIGFSEYIYTINHKFTAAEKLKKHLQGDKQIFTEFERGALQEGRLGEIFEEYCQGVSLKFDQIILPIVPDVTSCCPLVESPLFRL
jgi:hypothetical protein